MLILILCSTHLQCQSVAGVVLGDQKKIEYVQVTKENRFAQLNDRKIDLLVNFDSHTLKREVSEVSTFNFNC